jgi:hypothetical protein
MTQTRLALMSCLGLAVFFGLAHAEDRNATCGHYGRFAPITQVTGPVLSVGTNWWKMHYVIVQDKNSGCRVFIATEEKACTEGKTFDATGRLKTVTDEPYQATFHFFRGDRGEACRNG